MDIRGLDAERLLQASKAYCRWPNGMPVRLKGIGAEAFTAKILGGFEFDLGSIFVACDCESCAQKPALVGDDVKEEESYIMSILEFSIHCGVVDLIEQRLCEFTNNGGLDTEAVQLTASRMLPDMLFVLDVPCDGTSLAAAGSCDSGSRNHSLGVLPLSDFLRQSAEAAGGSNLEGRQLGAFVFTSSPAGVVTTRDMVSEGTANQHPMTAAEAGGGATLSIGKVVGYDTETGAHRVKFDRGPLLELLRHDEEAEGEEPKGALDAWVHVAVCHVALDPDLDPGLDPGLDSRQKSAVMNMDATRDDSATAAAAAAAALEKRGLFGPFRDCLQAVPSEWDSPRLDLLLQRRLQPPTENPDAANSVAATAAAAAVVKVLPPSPAQPASGGSEGGASVSAAAPLTAAVGELGGGDREAARGTEAANAAALAAAAAGGTEEWDMDVLDPGSKDLSGLPVEGLTASLALAAVSNGTAAATTTVSAAAAAASPTGFVEMDVEMQPNDTLEAAASVSTDPPAAEVRQLQPPQQQQQQLAELGDRVRCSSSSNGDAGCRWDSGGDVPAVSVPEGGGVAANVHQSASIAAPMVAAETEPASTTGTRGTGADTCNEAAHSAGGSRRTVDDTTTEVTVLDGLRRHEEAAAAVVLTEPAVAAATEGNINEGYDAFSEMELDVLLERAVRLRCGASPLPQPQEQPRHRSPQQLPQQRPGVRGGEVGVTEAHCDQEEGEKEEQEEEEEEEALALCTAIESLDGAMLQLGLRGPIRAKMLLCVWMMRSRQVRHLEEELRGAMERQNAAVAAAAPS